MGNHRSTKKAHLRYGALVLLVIFLISGGFLLLKIWERGQGQYPDIGTDIETKYLEHEGHRYVRREDVATFLVLGLDTFENNEYLESYDNDKRADFLLLLVLDHGNETVTAIQINRDTMVEMDYLDVSNRSIGRVTQQIALAHTEGNGREVSCRNTSDAVSRLLFGTKIDHYMSLTMDSVKIYTDLLGGVEVTVLDDFTGIDDTLLKGETAILSGDRALTYVRTRRGLEDSSNQNRMKRQEQVMRALYSASVTRMETDDAFALDAILSLSDHMISDRTVTQLQEIADTLFAYQFTDIVVPTGEARMGEKYIEFIPDETELKELVISLLYEEASGS